MWLCTLHSEDKACVKRVRDHLRFAVDETQTWVDCVEIGRVPGLIRLAVETAMWNVNARGVEVTARRAGRGTQVEGRTV